jgi:uncharacterized protein (TIRG00374 family)
MSQTVNEQAGSSPRRRLSTSLVRFAGLGLLVILLIRLDFDHIRSTLQSADWLLILFATLWIIPLIAIKTVRWQGILRSQAVRLAFGPALLVYFGSLFIGFLTPGRLGEFIKAVHVNRECDVPLSQSFASVLADRLFDLYALLLVGSAALLTGTLIAHSVLLVALLLIALIGPLVIFLHPATYAWTARVGLRFGALGRKLFAEDGLATKVRAGLRQLTWQWAAISTGLTAAAYLVFYGQCYLLAKALDLPVSFMTVTYAVALGSLVTLLPISISGLGTREAAMIAFLDTAGIEAETALSFSLLVFVSFYIGGGLIGALSWLVKPLPIGDTSGDRSPALTTE